MSCADQVVVTSTVKVVSRHLVRSSIADNQTVCPTITSTITGPKKTITASACVATVTYCPPKHYKRHFLEERLEGDDEDVEEEEVDELAGMTNAERIRRGLPLAKPVEKRTFGLGHGHGHGPEPPKGGPSCVPKTVKVEETKTVTKSVTPTKYVTTTKCAYTQTVQSTSYVTSVKTETQTKNAGHPTTVFTTVTPHQSTSSPFTAG